MTEFLSPFATEMVTASMFPAFTIRAPSEGDQGYITSTWLKSLRRTPMLRHWTRRDFFARVGADVDRLLDRPDTAALLAVVERRPSEILGWIVWTEVPAVPVLHYAYVRRGWSEHRIRGQGVGRALAHEAGLRKDRPMAYTSRGPDARRLLSRWTKAVYMPVAEFLS